VDPTSLACSFAPAADPEASHVRYFACASTSSSIGVNGTGVCDARRWTRISVDEGSQAGNSTHNGTLSGLKLVVGTKYFMIVRACNNANLCNATATKGVTIGTT
jgi:hypothetical protein